jgi:hypothetical protein
MIYISSFHLQRPTKSEAQMFDMLNHCPLEMSRVENVYINTCVIILKQLEI